MVKQFKTTPIPATFVVLASLCPASALAQGCSVDFTAKVTPAAGISEPVRGLPFYLLNKSFTEILADADAAEPKPDLDAYVDKLRVSKELKVWMKKNRSVSLSGEEFVRGLSADDVMNVPEFFSAYLDRNGSDSTIDFPKPKYREKDKEKDPARYEKQRQEYLDAIRKYLVANTESTAGLDLPLDPINPDPPWARVVGPRRPAIQRRALEMAQTHYMVAKAQSDLDGHARMDNVPPGNYWLGTLDIFPSVGDAHLRREVPGLPEPGLTPARGFS